jgi:hypothetical protein
VERGRDASAPSRIVATAMLQPATARSCATARCARRDRSSSPPASGKRRPADGLRDARVPRRQATAHGRASSGR